jgi:inorganic pyrophosphatase
VARADQDPLDVCILTEHRINRGGILLRARVIGGLSLIDGDEADDKIIAVLLEDPAYGDFREIEHAPTGLIDRLRHYFLTYKESPDALQSGHPRCEIARVYGSADAIEVIRCACADYTDRFGQPTNT